MSVPIRIGYHTNNALNIAELKKLQSLEIVELIEEKYQYCKKCQTKIGVNSQFLAEGLKTCPICAKTATLSNNAFSVFKIDKINYKKIIELIHKALDSAVGQKAVSYDEERHSWV